MSDRSNENPILDPGGSIAEQLAAKDAEIERRRGLIHDMTNALRRANEKNDAAEARAEKLAAALRDAGECLSKWDTEVAKARQIIARALAEIGEEEKK